jgi:acyl-CoA synthetase (AMP-forming)/AMP-acid ligase II
MTTIAQLLERQARDHGERPALLAPGHPTVSYSALWRAVRSFGGQLRKAGIGSADRVAIVLPNGPEMALTFLAVAAAAPAAPLNPAYVESELEFYLTDLGAKALIASAGVESSATRVAASLGIPVLSLAAGETGEECEFAPAASDTALLLHTSGTTSRPKLVPLSHGNLCVSARNIAATLGLRPEDRCLNVMPLFHIHGLAAALLASITAGASVICTPGYRSGGAFFAWMSEFRPTWYTAVPTMHQAIVAEAGGHTAAIRNCPLRLIRSSSAALPGLVLQRLEKAFGAPVIEAYGMTEASHQMASNPLPPGVRKPGSVGVAAGPEVAIMDATGELRAAGQTGEVVIRGASVTAGYESNATANEGAFTRGWFRTGDEGYQDQDGYLFLTARIKEIINRGGEKISPREVDEALLEHPAVAQAVAFAMPHPTLGEEVGAAVVLRAGATATVADLRSFAKAKLAEFKVPRRIVLVDDIPKGATGKIQRIGLAGQLQLGGGHVEPRTELERRLAAVWAEILELETVGVEEDFFALGGDSLAAATLVTRIEEMIPEAAGVPNLVEATTVAEMARQISLFRLDA